MKEENEMDADAPVTSENKNTDTSGRTTYVRLESTENPRSERVEGERRRRKRFANHSYKSNFITTASPLP